MARLDSATLSSPPPFLMQNETFFTEKRDLQAFHVGWQGGDRKAVLQEKPA